MNRFEQSAGRSSDVIHARVLSILETQRDRGTAVLDLGCGQGEFLRTLSERGWTRLLGADAYEHSDTKALPFRFLKSDLNGSIPLPNASVDVVTAIEVIEHLENPRLFVREIFRLLKPGGLAIVTTPNNECVTSLVSFVTRGYFSSFADACYPAHITPLLQIDLRRILNEAGFGNVEFSWTNQGRMPGVNLSWRKVLGPIARGKRFSDNIIVQGRK